MSGSTHPGTPYRRRFDSRGVMGLVMIGFGACAALPGTAGATPMIQHWQTKNGVRVLFVETHQLPMVDIQAVFDAGSARDGDKAGLARLTNTLLDDGAGGLDADQIAERFDSVGAQYNVNADRDSATVSVRSLSDAGLLHTAVDTLAKVLQDPAFPKDAFERERKRMLVALDQEQESLSDIATKTFFKSLYGDHPYATPPSGTRETLNKLARSDVVAFHRRYYVAANAVVVIVGDLDRAKAKTLADAVIDKLPAGRAAPPLPPVPALDKSRTVTVPHPSTQTHVLSGEPGISRSDKDYFPLFVGNHILGGNGLVSRLSEEIREKRGLSYNTYSYFDPMRVKGPFIMGLQTRNDKVDEAVKIMDKTLVAFVAKGPTQKELKEARQNITGGFPLRIDSNAKILDYLSLIGFYKLPLDYLNTFNQHVEQVTLADIRTAFKAHLQPDKRLTVVVGGGAKAFPR